MNNLNELFSNRVSVNEGSRAHAYQFDIAKFEAIKPLNLQFDQNKQIPLQFEYPKEIVYGGGKKPVQITVDLYESNPQNAQTLGRNFDAVLQRLRQLTSVKILSNGYQNKYIFKDFPQCHLVIDDLYHLRSTEDRFRISCHQIMNQVEIENAAIFMKNVIESGCQYTL